MRWSINSTISIEHSTVPMRQNWRASWRHMLLLRSLSFRLFTFARELWWLWWWTRGCPICSTASCQLQHIRLTPHPPLHHCGNRGLSTWQRQPPQLKRCGNSEEFTRPVPDSGNCLYLLCGPCRRDACKSLDAHSGNPSVKKLRSPIRRCHLSAVRHPG